MKGLRIGRRRERRESEVPLSPLELALRPALVDGRWQVPDRFNFTSDVVEALARDPKRRALTVLTSDGVIEPRTFLEISEGASVWAVALREQGVGPGDRVVLMAGSTVDWLEAVLGIWKVGGVVVPTLPTTGPAQLERLVSSTDAALVVAERSLEPTVEGMGFTPETHFYEGGVKRSSKDAPTDVPTYDTASRDLAFVVSTTGVGGASKQVAHTHGSVFATRVQAEHWLDVGRGDTVWCTAEATSPLTTWNTVVGPWSRGAEIALQHGEFDLDERLDLLFRLGASILCQSSAEYSALAEHPKLERFRSPRLRRLVSTGDYLDPEVVAVFEERWGLSIADGYGQAETNIVVANLADGPVKPGSIGRALPGHHVAVIDDQGNELPIGIEGDLAIRGRPPTLFAGYWERPEETKSAFLGDWYLTGDVAHVDEEGYFTFVGRAEDVITSSGRTFGPYEAESALARHPAIAAAAVVGIRDLQRGGQFVRAFVAPKSAALGSEQLEAELREYVAEVLPVQQVPREIVFVDGLPRVGWKVSRIELRDRPLAGRPLWETPESELPAVEAALAAVQAPPPAVAFVEQPVAVEPVAVESVAVEPVAVEPPPVVVPEPPPVAEPPPALPPEPAPAPAPEPVAAEAIPVPEPAPAEAVVATPEPQLEQAPEPPVAEAAAEPVHAPATSEQPAPEPPAAPADEPALPVAEAAPAPQPSEPDPEPVAVVAPDPQPEPEAAAPAEQAPVERLQPTVLPDYVIDQPDEIPPVVLPEPEPEPDLSGPLPEFVIEPAPAEAAPVPRLEPVATAEEESLGPLPDYVIDPDDPRAARKHAPPAPPPEPTPILMPRPVAQEEPPESPALNFPSAGAVSIPRKDQTDAEPHEARAARPRPPAESDAPSHEPASAEPGDEGSGEVGWMAGLSNRLSAYSLAEDEERAARPDDDTVDEA